MLAATALSAAGNTAARAAAAGGYAAPALKQQMLAGSMAREDSVLPVPSDVTPQLPSPRTLV